MIPAMFGAAGAAGTAGAMGADGNGFLNWMDMFNPKVKGSYMEKLGMLKPNEQAVNSNTNMQQAGMRDMQQQPMNMMQLMQMMQSMNQNQNRGQQPMGLMSPQQQKPFRGGLWE